MSKYKHECPEWDGLDIDETMHEFAFCECFPHDSTAWDYKERLAEEVMDMHKESTVVAFEPEWPPDTGIRVFYEGPAPEQMELDFNET